MKAAPPARPTGAAPYWRLSAFYLFYFASLGALIPYWGLYLKGKGFSALEIGELMALIMVTKVISPNVWGWIADHTGRRMAIVRLGALCAVLSFLGVFFGQGYAWLAVTMLLFSFFWNAALPQFEATTFTHLGEETHRYSSIRLWGSIGFIVTVAVLGAVIQWRGAHVLPWALLLLFAGIWLASLRVPEQAAGHLHLDHVPLRKVLLRPEVAALLTVCFLMQASHGPYYTFYTIYLEDHGYASALIGGLWALGVVAEVGVFLVMHQWVPRFGVGRLLQTSLLLAGVRWLLIGTQVDHLAVLVFAQLLHAASFGIYHASAIELIHRYFTGRHQGKGQALYSSLSFGAGGALGSYYAGLGWDSLGPAAVFGIAALLNLLALILAWRYLPRRAPLSV